jgi:hypothetical protein
MELFKTCHLKTLLYVRELAKVLSLGQNISPALYSKLEYEARQHHRSITQEIVALLEQSLSKTQPSIPPTPIDLGVKHDSEWVGATCERRFAGMTKMN